MSKKWIALLSVTAVLLIAVACLVLPAKLQKAQTEEPQLSLKDLTIGIPEDIEITYEKCEDGSTDFCIPIFVSYPPASYYEVQYKTVNSKDFPVIIPVEVNEDVRVEITIDFNDGELSLETKEV